MKIINFCSCRHKKHLFLIPQNYFRIYCSKCKLKIGIKLKISNCFCLNLSMENSCISKKNSNSKNFVPSRLNHPNNTEVN